MSKSKDCQECVLKYLEGDTSQLDKIKELLDPMIANIIMKHNPNDNFDDLYQTAWVAVMKCLHNYNLDKKVLFTTYTYRAISNDLIMYKRKESKHTTSYDEEGKPKRVITSFDKTIRVSSRGMESNITLHDILYDDDSDVEEKTLITTSIPIIEDIINEFPKTQKSILELFMKGERQSDIAAILDIHPSYVSNTVKAFYIKCREALN